MSKPRGFLLLAAGLLLSFGAAWSGDFKTPYFGATKPGAWAQYLLTSPDGSKSSYVYEREGDDDGRTVIEVRCKIIEGSGQDSRVKNSHTLARSFDLDRDGLSYVKFTEKMSMNYNGSDMPVDDATLAIVRESAKDFRGTVAFEGTQKIGDRTCDRYAYSLKTGGPAPTVETGRLWLDPTVPFAIVRQVAKATKEDGTLISEFDMQLQETGLNQVIAGNSAPPPATAPENFTAPSSLSLASSFKAGLVGMEIEAVPTSAGRELRLTLVNKTDAELVVRVPSGDADFVVDSPVHTLSVTFPQASSVVLPANDKSVPLSVAQRGKRGITEGKCALSVYEGTPLFSGSVTMGSLPK